MLKIQNETIVKILWKQIQGELTTTEENKILEEWRSGSEFNQSLIDEISEEQWKNDLKVSLSGNESAIWNKILPSIEEKKDVPMIGSNVHRAWYKYAVAAALIGVTFSAGIYFLGSDNKEKQIAKTTTVTKQKPGTSRDDRAYLKLSDGSIIYLNEAENGELALEGDSKIKKLKDGELVYDAADKNLATNQLPLTFNILSTPKGTLYKLILQDGSKIWLNAASSLRFPSSFNDGERVVELTGEAYFEIAPTKLSSGQPGQNSRNPFCVKTNGVKVEVLGTRFDVMAYKDEPTIKTSLLQGAVKISTGTDAYILKPGQQAQVVNPVMTANADSRITVMKTGAENGIAWKNGYLDFRSADIPTVMRQIGRAYNVDVVYKGVPKDIFSGKISIQTSIQEVVTALELSGIHVSLQNGKLEVTP